MKVEPKHPALIVLRSLMIGVPVTIEGEEYWMDPESRKVAIRRELINTKTGETKEVFICPDMSVGAFVKMCEKLSENEVFEIVGNIVLNESNRKERNL